MWLRRARCASVSGASRSTRFPRKLTRPLRTDRAIDAILSDVIVLLDERLDAVREFRAVAAVPPDAKLTAGRISGAPHSGPGDITDVPEDAESDDPSLRRSLPGVVRLRIPNQ